MWLIFIVFFAVLVLAGLVAAFAAYPHRGASIPHASWLSDAMVRANRRINESLRR